MSRPSPHLRFWPSGLPHKLSVPRTTLHDAFAVSARRFGDKPLCRFFGRTLSYAEGWNQVESLAGFLQHACGVRQGDRVLLDMQNCPQFIVALFAILRADAVAVPVSPMNLTGELAHYLEDSGARVALTAQERFPQFEPLLGHALDHLVVAAYSDCAGRDGLERAPDAVRAPRARLSAPGVTHWSDALAAGHAPGASVARPHDLALLPYTSGSTGQPKGCMHTHATVMHNVLGAVLWESMHQDSVALATAPFFHVTGLVHSLLASVYTGATIVVQPRWDPVLAARLIEQHRCTHWANVPAMVVDILTNPHALEHDVSSLACVFGGGQSMPEAIAQKLLDNCGIHYMEGYGMTETISQTHSNPALRTKKQCLGVPHFGTESRIVEPGSPVVLGPGEAGEIVVRGPQLLTGYWRNDAAYRESWIEVEGESFFRTGDLGRMDEEGYYFISDRLKRMINAAGYKVWPAEVEGAMYRHPAIQECCIIASPDARRGETVKAVVVLRPEARSSVSGGQILAWAHEHMAAYKAPRTIVFVDALPRSGSGKIQWRALQEAEFDTATGRVPGAG